MASILTDLGRLKQIGGMEKLIKRLTPGEIRKTTELEHFHLPQVRLPLKIVSNTGVKNVSRGFHL